MESVKHVSIIVSVCARAFFLARLFFCWCSLIYSSWDDIHHPMMLRAERHCYLTLQRAQMTWTVCLGLIKCSFPTSRTRITDKLWSQNMWSWNVFIGLMRCDLSKRRLIPNACLSSWCLTTIGRCFEAGYESKMAVAFHPNSSNCQYFLKLHESWIPDLNHSRTID